jgi:transcriptional regulator with XRE-family HTH domain
LSESPSCCVSFRTGSCEPRLATHASVKLASGCVNTDREAFGPFLRQRRESRGLTLKDIANSSKIQESLLAALERNDVSRWPTGIVRRGFLREYAAAVGLPPERLVAEFTHLFPEDSLSSSPGLCRYAEIDSGLRLTLAASGRWRVTAIPRQLSVAVLDLGAVLLLSILGAFLTRTGIWLFLGAVGLSYWTLGTAFGGRSVGAWWMNRGTSRSNRAREQEAVTDRSAREFLHLVVSGGQHIPASGGVDADSQRDHSTRRVSA